MLVLSGAMAVVLAVCGFVLFATRGLPQRIPPEIARRIADFYTASITDDVFQHGCYEHLSYRQFLQAGVCHFGAGQPDLLLWGDSHAAAIVPALELLAARHSRGGMWTADPGCAPLLGVRYSGIRGCLPRKDARFNIALRRDVV